MIDVLYTRFSAKFPEKIWQRHLSKIPKGMQEEIKRFRKWQDRQAKLLGRLLLIEALKGFGFDGDVLGNLSYNEFGRPFLNDRIDFNISHSGGCVICAATDMARVGIDIEAIRPIDLNDFKDFLTSREWVCIQRADRPYEKFFEYWTIKESILKANGKGLSVPLSEIHYHGEFATVYDKIWYFNEISVDSNYKCYLATNEKDPDLLIREISW